MKFQYETISLLDLNHCLPNPTGRLQLHSHTWSNLLNRSPTHNGTNPDFSFTYKLSCHSRMIIEQTTLTSLSIQIVHSLNMMSPFNTFLQSILLLNIFAADVVGAVNPLNELTQLKTKRAQYWHKCNLQVTYNCKT